MYFNKKNNFYHGIMFHHFHDQKRHIKSQGSISAKQFERLIKLIGPDKFLTPYDFMDKCQNKALKKNDLCLTFDDSLKCQFDIAVPVMKKLNLKSFFFVSSSIFTNNADKLELYRFFRHKYYKTMDLFYNNFFIKVEKLFPKTNLRFFFNEKRNLISNLRKKHPMYSKNDILFRIVRDRMLKRKQYDLIMHKMFIEKNFDFKKKLKNLYLREKEIKQLDKDGHMIGLHSHSHPNLIEKLNFKNQLKEYKLNKAILEKLLKKKIYSMSHPSGSYNSQTLKILKKLGIIIGFKQIMIKDRNMKKINNTNFEIARANHSEIIRRHRII